MPLRLLIPSLERVNVASSTSLSSPHPLHDLLKPLLLSSRAVSGKYHTELPAILNSGGGEGEVEETMMWYALHHEKADEDPDAKLESPDDPWSSSKWRSKWFDRLERREYIPLSSSHLVRTRSNEMLQSTDSNPTQHAPAILTWPSTPS